ncbi:hypothetical protein [Thermococcus piezophilus]|uniref:hypothetical protein n=1 Tax=Thermococcus piezophilus TaxID=1712654 RepID=UPI0019023370|nr:hypothetical protein [Thermococcus piezophilus]
MAPVIFQENNIAGERTPKAPESNSGHFRPIYLTEIPANTDTTTPSVFFSVPILENNFFKLALPKVSTAQASKEPEMKAIPALPSTAERITM